MFISGFECLGACDIAPMASIDETYYGPLADGDAATIVEQLRAGARSRPGQGDPPPQGRAAAPTARPIPVFPQTLTPPDAKRRRWQAVEF